MQLTPENVSFLIKDLIERIQLLQEEIGENFQKGMKATDSYMVYQVQKLEEIWEKIRRMEHQKDPKIDYDLSFLQEDKK